MNKFKNFVTTGREIFLGLSILEMAIWYTVASVILIAATGVVTRITPLVDYIYDDLGYGAYCVKSTIIAADVYDTLGLEYRLDYSDDTLAVFNALYGTHYTNKMLAIAEQVKRERENIHVQTIEVLYFDMENLLDLRVRDNMSTTLKIEEFQAYDIGKSEDEYDWHYGESHIYNNTVLDVVDDIWDNSEELCSAIKGEQSFEEAFEYIFM